MSEVEIEIEKSFTLKTVQAIVEAMNRGYAMYRVTSESFSDSRYAKIAAGTVRNRHVDLRLRELGGQVRGWEATTVSLPKNPHSFTVIRYGKFMIVCCAQPRNRKLPKESKSRLLLAEQSLIAPMQQGLWMEELRKRTFPEPLDGVIFSVLSHYAFEDDKSKLGGLDLVLVTRAYEYAGSVDLIGRSRKLRDLGVSTVEVAIPVIRRKNQER